MIAHPSPHKTRIECLYFSATGSLRVIKGGGNPETITGVDQKVLYSLLDGWLAEGLDVYLKSA